MVMCGDGSQIEGGWVKEGRGGGYARDYMPFCNAVYEVDVMCRVSYHACDITHSHTSEHSRMYLSHTLPTPNACHIHISHVYSCITHAPVYTLLMSHAPTLEHQRRSTGKASHCADRSQIQFSDLESLVGWLTVGG